MFEDQTPNKQNLPQVSPNQPPQAGPARAGSARPPGNLPVAERGQSPSEKEPRPPVRDIGEEPAKDKGPGVEDIFDSIDTSTQAVKGERTQGQTISQGLPSGSNIPVDLDKIKTMPPKHLMPGLESKALPAQKKAVIILVSVVLIVGLGLGGFLAYKRFFTQPQPPASEEIITPPVEEAVPSEPEESGLLEPESALPIEEEESLPPATSGEPQGGLDNDGDGLTNDEEAALGTNFDDPDTDGDDLPDLDEVRVYKTDPLNPDTDGDGYSDGTEVKNGYDPNGPGRLLNLP